MNKLTGFPFEPFDDIATLDGGGIGAGFPSPG